MMRKKFLHCHDISLNCQEMIPRYLALGQFDSIRIVLQYWGNRCPSNPERLVTEVLFRIGAGEFDDHDYEDLLHALLAYKFHAVEADNDHHSYTYPSDDYSRYTEILRTYREFLRNYARETKAGTKPNSLESMLCDFYDHEFTPLLEALKANAFPETYLQRSFVKERERLMDLYDRHWAGFFEYWIPRGKATTLGNHPGIGMTFGFRKKTFSVDFTGLARFGKASNAYSIYQKDSLYTTRDFSGVYAGAEAAKAFFRTRRSELAASGGIGYESITAVPADEAKGIEAVDVGTFNLSAGLGYRYYYSEIGAYVGIQARYNVIDYFAKGGTDLSGHALTLRLFWGTSGNPYRYNALKRLGY